MKRLTLVRHAKSSWKNAALADLDIASWRETSPGCGRAALYVVTKERPANFPAGTEK